MPPSAAQAAHVGVCIPSIQIVHGHVGLIGPREATCEPISVLLQVAALMLKYIVCNESRASSILSTLRSAF